MSKNAKTCTAANFSELVRRYPFTSDCNQPAHETACNMFRQFQRSGTKSSPLDERDNWAKKSTLAWSCSMRSNSPGWRRWPSILTKTNLISSLASRPDAVTQAELRKATGWLGISEVSVQANRKALLEQISAKHFGKPRKIATGDFSRFRRRILHRRHRRGCRWRTQHAALSPTSHAGVLEPAP